MAGYPNSFFHANGRTPTHSTFERRSKAEDLQFNDFESFKDELSMPGAYIDLTESATHPDTREYAGGYESARMQTVYPQRRDENTRRNREKRHKIRDHLKNTKEEFAECRKQLQASQQYNMNLDTEIGELEHQLAIAQKENEQYKSGAKHLDETLKEVQSLQAELKDTQTQLRTYSEENSRLRKDVGRTSSMERKLITSQKDLQLCRDELFRLQPLTQVSDSEISRDFETLSRQIVNWMDAEVDASEDAHSENNIGHLFSTGSDENVAYFMIQHPDVGEYLARYFIHHYIQEHLLGAKVYLLGLPPTIVQLLQEAEEAMTRLKPTREPATIASWRSETLTALTAIADWRQDFERRVQEINSGLFDTLSNVFPILFRKGERREDFHQKITLPAAMLATKLRLSTNTYVFEMLSDPYVNFEPAKLAHLEVVRMIDIKTSKILKSDSQMISDTRGVIGKFVLPLEPGLYRVVSGKKEIALRPSQFLVRLNHPLLKREPGLA